MGSVRSLEHSACPTCMRHRNPSMSHRDNVNGQYLRREIFQLLKPERVKQEPLAAERRSGPSWSTASGFFTTQSDGMSSTTSSRRYNSGAVIFRAWRVPRKSDVVQASFPPATTASMVWRRVASRPLPPNPASSPTTASTPLLSLEITQYENHLQA